MLASQPNTPNAVAPSTRAPKPHAVAASTQAISTAPMKLPTNCVPSSAPMLAGSAFALATTTNKDGFAFAFAAQASIVGLSLILAGSMLGSM